MSKECVLCIFSLRVIDEAIFFARMLELNKGNIAERNDLKAEP